MPTINARNVPSLRDYAEALAFYTKTKPWRDSQEWGEARPLDKRNRRKKHFNIRIDEEKSICCRLCNTDCVVYHKNGEIEIDATYKSISTNSFINKLLSKNRVMCDSLLDCFWLNHWVGWEEGYHQGQGYKCDRPIRIKEEDGVWKLVSEPRKWEYPILNQRRAREKLKELHYAEFVPWCYAYISVQGINPNWALYKWRRRGNKVIPAYPANLLDRENWRVIADHATTYKDEITLKGYLNAFRRRIYFNFDCYEVEELDFVEHDSQIRRIRRYKNEY